MENIREVILCKYGELILKGANLSFFENLLTKELKQRAARHGHFAISHRQSTLAGCTRLVTLRGRRLEE